MLQAQSTLLQQPNTLLIQSQALAPQMPTQPSALHSQLLTSQIGSLQQQVSIVVNYMYAIHNMCTPVLTFEVVLAISCWPGSVKVLFVFDTVLAFCINAECAPATVLTLRTSLLRLL